MAKPEIDREALIAIGRDQPGRAIQCIALGLRACAIEDGARPQDTRYHVVRALFAAALALETGDASALKSPYKNDDAPYDATMKGPDVAKAIVAWVTEAKHTARLREACAACDAASSAKETRAAEGALDVAVRELVFWSAKPLFYPAHLPIDGVSEEGRDTRMVRCVRKVVFPPAQWTDLDLAKALARGWTGNEALVTGIFRGV